MPCLLSSGTTNHKDSLCHLARGDLDAGRICGYGTARCRRHCRRGDFKIGTCPNASLCCLKKRNATLEMSMNTEAPWHLVTSHWASKPRLMTGTSLGTATDSTIKQGFTRPSLEAEAGRPSVADTRPRPSGPTPASSGCAKGGQRCESTSTPPRA